MRTSQVVEVVKPKPYKVKPIRRKVGPFKLQTEVRAKSRQHKRQAAKTKFSLKEVSPKPRKAYKKTKPKPKKPKVKKPKPT